MSGELKPVPAGAEQLKSFQFFQETCQAELDKRAKAAGKAPVKFDVNNAKVFNRADGDGKFDIIYKDESLDFKCGAQVLWQSQEILIRSGKLSEEASKPVAGTWISDAATMTEKLVGKDEFAGQACQDDVADFRLVGADKYTSVQEFNKQCTELFDQFSRQKYGLKLGSGFDLKHTRILNSSKGDGIYNLFFENRANNFFCEGVVDSSAHAMSVRGGSFKDYETLEAKTAISMKDACTMTTGLVGKDELVKADECKDRSAKELSWEKGMSYTFYTGVWALGMWQGYKYYQKLAAMPRVAGFARLPVVRNLGWGALSYFGYDTLASNFVPEDHPARKYGKWVAGGAGLLAPEIIAKTGIATRLASLPVASRLAPFAGRVTWGLAAVWATNAIWSFVNGNSEYQTSVNKRVTDMIYDKHVYELDGWDFLVLPLAVKGIRASCRFIAPDMMESAISTDNKELEAAMIKEDKNNSEQIEELMRQVLPEFLYSQNPEDRDEMLKLLRQPVSMSVPESVQAAVLFKNPEEGGGLEGLKKLYPEMSDSDIEKFARKAVAAKIQVGAAVLVYIDQPLNDWAREFFNKDGTLKNGLELEKKLTERWPAPASAKHADNTITNEQIELAQAHAHMG